MKLAVHNNKLETNVKSDNENFGIGDASVVIEILRNRLYENKIQTLVQEYISNARDAMREIGKGNNFQVSIPTVLDPTFRVRDYGPGISPDRMKNVFIKYGASTKRDSNNQTGGFGIGAKSAWSYTDSFTITTYIQGTKRVYLAHTGTNNNGRLDHLSTEPTKEVDGTEIQVPVKPEDKREFRDAVFRAIYFWTDRPVVKGETELPVLIQGFKVKESVEFFAYNNYYTGAPDSLPNFLTGEDRSPIAVIDGIPYALPEKLTDKLKKFEKLDSLTSKRIVLYLDNGVVEVSASRESIADSLKSISSLNITISKAIFEIETYLTKEFKAVKSFREFINKYDELSKVFTCTRFSKYGEYSINGDRLEAIDYFSKVNITRVTLGLNRNQNYTVKREALSGWLPKLHQIKTLYFSDTNESIVIQNRRLRDNYPGTTMQEIFIVTPKSNFETEFRALIKDLEPTDILTLNWTPVTKEIREKIKKDKNDICLHQVSYYGREHKTIQLNENQENWLYFPLKGNVKKLPSQLKGVRIEDLKHFAKYLNNKADLNLCGVASSSVEKIKSDSRFTTLQSWLDKFTPSNEDLAYVKYLNRKNSIEHIESLKDLEDSVVVEMIKEYKKISKAINSMVSRSMPDLILNLVKESKEFKEFEKKDDQFTKALDNYPLLKSLSYNVDSKEVVFYMNARYNSRKEK